MDLDKLKLLVRVQELKSFSLAAVDLGVAQPTVSRVIKDLETDWGDRVFHRTGRGVTLTEFGEQAVARARLLLAEADRMTQDLKGMSREPVGKVSLGLAPSLAQTLAPPLVRQLARETPGIALRIHEGFSDQIERWRAAGDIDVGVWSNFRVVESGDENRKALFRSNLVLVGPGDGPRMPASMPFEDLAHYPLVLPAMPNGLRAICEEIARRKNIALKIPVETDSLIVQKQVCQHCGYYLIKAPETMAQEVRQGIHQTSVITEPTVQRFLLLDTTRQRPLSRAALEVTTRLTTLLRQLSPR